MPLRPLALLLVSLAAFAASPTPFDAIQALLPQLAPPELRGADAKRFSEWAAQHDRAIRARLEDGDLDSMVNLLLFGTSFTSQPRMTIANLAAETRAGLLRARLTDFQKTLAAPGNNLRLIQVRDLLQKKHFDPSSQPAGTYILDNLQRVLRERIEFNERLEKQDSSANVFSTRGVSLDTTIFPNYGVDSALRELQANGLLKPVTRIAILGPGLDFIDKESGFDYYPQQTLQPFAVADSLARLKLGEPKITILDISPHVLSHIRGALINARNRHPYSIQLPRDTSANWTAATLGYWNEFGSALARPDNPLPPPASLLNIDTRAVRFPASTVLKMDAADLNIVTERLTLATAERYDLIVATNMLVYYDPFEQALALANISSMLKPGGLLLTNDELPRHPAIPLKLVNRTQVVYAEEPRRGDTFYAYKRP